MGRPIEPPKLQELQAQLLEQVGGLMFFPQPNEGFWTMAGMTYRDTIVIYRILTSNAQEAQQFFASLNIWLRFFHKEGSSALSK